MKMYKIMACAGTFCLVSSVFLMAAFGFNQMAGTMIPGVFLIISAGIAYGG